MKFVVIVFNTYWNFIKLSNTSTIFWKASIKFEYIFCKIYTNFIHKLPKFLKNFQNFLEFFPNISLIFFQNFNKYYSKLVLFKFLLYFFHSSPFLYRHFIEFFFLQNFQFFFNDLLKVSISYSWNLHKFLFWFTSKFSCRFPKYFKIFFKHSNYFSHKINCQ